MKTKQLLMITGILIEALQAIQHNLEETAPREKIESAHDCPKCGAEMQDGEWGIYCRPCYLKRKEKNWKRSRNY